MAEKWQCGSDSDPASPLQSFESFNRKDCQPAPQSLQVTTTTKESNPFAEFLIIDRKYDKKQETFLLTLMDSASFSGFELEFFLNKTQEMYDHEYSALIKGISENFPSAFGVNKCDARNKAAQLALETLSRYCYTVKYKEHKEVLLSDILDNRATSTSSSLSVSQPLKDTLTESSFIEAVPDRMLDSDHQGNYMHVNTRHDTCETHMSSASKNIYLQCSEHKGALSDMLHNKATSSCPLVSHSLKYTQTESAWSEEIPDRMLGSDLKEYNLQMNAGCNNTYGFQISSLVSKNISSDFPHHEDSFGSKMLKMMGWAGGGLGKDGSGIVEPIKSSQVVGRYGVGHKKRKECDEFQQLDDKGKTGIKRKGSQIIEKCKNKGFFYNEEKFKKEPVQQPVSLKKITDARFEDAIHAIINHFIENPKDQELVFSRQLSNLQRKIIHDIAETYDLSSISFGRHGTRHIVLFREHSTEDFLQNLLHDQSLSESAKNYQIIPPSAD